MIGKQVLTMTNNTLKVTKIRTNVQFPRRSPCLFPLTILFHPKRNKLPGEYPPFTLIGFFNPFAEKNGGFAAGVIFSVKIDYKTNAFPTLYWITPHLNYTHQ